MNNTSSNINLEKAYQTRFWEKLTAYVKSKIPNATDLDIKWAEEISWTGGNLDEPEPNSIRERIFDIVNDGSIARLVGATESEYNDYINLIGK